METHPSIKSTRQVRAQVDTTQRKNKNKQSTKIGKGPINYNKEALRQRGPKTKEL
jgi:hypothetical protein